MTALTNSLAYAAAVAWLLFALWYQIRARWWVTPEGRNVMAVALGIVAMLGLAALARVAPDWPGRPWAQLVVFAGLIVLAIQRTVQLERAQRRDAPCPKGPRHRAD